MRLDLFPKCCSASLLLGCLAMCICLLSFKIKIPGADYSITSASVSANICLAFRGLPHSQGREAHKRDRSSSKARPFTPSLCPPGELARGRTVIWLATCLAQYHGDVWGETDHSLSSGASSWPYAGWGRGVGDLVSGGPFATLRLGHLFSGA